MPSSNIDFNMFKRLFLHKYLQLENEFLFREATGYYCVDEGDIRGIWGTDIDSFIFLNLRMTDIWPPHKKIDNYDEPTLFSLIEFLYDYVSEPQSKRWHDYSQCGWHTWDYDKEKGQLRFREEINNLLKDYSGGYFLSKDGEIFSVPPNGFEMLTQEIIHTSDPDNIDNRIQSAIEKYHRYGASLNEKKDAIRTLADVLEYLKSQNIRLQSRDESALFNIINNFDIRHHNQLQNRDYSRDVWYNWFFYTFLASINALLKIQQV